MRTHDRAAARRTDEQWIADAWAAAGARTLVFSGARASASGGVVQWSLPADVQAGMRIFLGLVDDGPRFAVIRDDRADGGEWLGLRQLFPLLSPDDAGLIVQAFGLAEWHKATRHCPACGALLEPIKAGHELRCPDCGRVQFPRTDPAVIMLITDDEDRALLGRQAAWPAGFWSSPAGFVEPGETLEDAVRREVFEESGVVVGDVSYFASQPWPMPSSVMLAFRGRAVATDITVDKSELEDARWFSRDEFKRGADDGTLLVPSGVSISCDLVADWYGGELPGTWR